MNNQRNYRINVCIDGSIADSFILCAESADEAEERVRTNVTFRVDEVGRHEYVVYVYAYEFEIACIYKRALCSEDARLLVDEGIEYETI